MDERPYFSHSADPGGIWHRLREHLGFGATIARTLAGSAPWAAEANLARLLRDIGKYGDLFQGRLRGEQAGIDHWSLGVSSPTVFRHDCRTFTHLATGYGRHIAEPCETGREGPLAAESQSGSHHESYHRRSRLGSIQTPVATDRFPVRRVTPASQLLTLVPRRPGFAVSWTTDARRVQHYCPRHAQLDAFPATLPGASCCRNRNSNYSPPHRCSCTRLGLSA